MTGRRTKNFPHRPRPRQRRQASSPPALPQGGLLTTLTNAEAVSWIVSAEGASFESKDALKARGYRWDPDRRVWWTEIPDDARTAEEFWLAANVYSASRNARSMAPRFERITAAERFL